MRCVCNATARRIRPLFSGLTDRDPRKHQVDSRRLAFPCAAALVLAASASIADPWLPPGDTGLRHDIAVLADRGVLRTPIMSWPLSWPDIARDVLNVRDREKLDAATAAALARVEREARRAASTGQVRTHARIAGAAEPTALRTFAATPREEGEVEAGFDWTGQRFAARMQVTAVADADDGQTLRPDGSYIGVNAWNFMVSAGYMERWWGPGWEGSLILSNSARPIPAVSIERNYSDAFKPRWLSWIGPWRASIVLGQLEGSRTDFANARFLAMRVSFKPLQQLEIGLSRSAQWCGEGRPCGLGTFKDLLIGNDNNQASSAQPGNQLAGYDLRWAFRSIPLALYGQFIGEDEASGMPAKFLGLMGAETWGDMSWGQWRVHAEYADTACNFSRSEPLFNCGYESTIYTQGYRYRGRSIGHAMDSDGRMVSVGGLLIDRAGHQWELLARTADLNRNATSAEINHTVAPLAAKLSNVELSHTRDMSFGRVQLGVGFDDYSRRLDGGDSSEVRGFIQWSKEIR